MTQVLILGGTGQIGSCLTRLAEERGYHATVVHRGRTRPAGSKGVSYVVADRAEAGGGRLGSTSWDIVFDICAYNRNDVSSFLRDPIRKSARYVLVSSIAVYPAGKAWREVQAPPLTAYPSAPGGYARNKREAEEAAFSLCDNTAVVRLPFVIGGPAGHGIFEREKERVRRQKVAYVESPGAALSVIHASDAARFLLELGEASRTSGTWNACSDGHLTVAGYLKQLAKRCWGRELQVEPVHGPRRSGFEVHTAWETQEMLSRYSIAADWTLDNTLATSLGYRFPTAEDTLVKLSSP